MLEAIGLILALAGAAASVIGSWYVASDIKHDRRLGYLTWICGNPVNITVLLGAILGVWTCLPLVITICVQVYYMCTAWRGWKSNE